MERERDAVDDFLDSLVGTDPAYEDIDILDLPEVAADPEAVACILATLPVVNGRRVSSPVVTVSRGRSAGDSLPSGADPGSRGSGIGVGSWPIRARR